MPVAPKCRVVATGRGEKRATGREASSLDLFAGGPAQPTPELMNTLAAKADREDEEARQIAGLIVDHHANSCSKHLTAEIASVNRGVPC